jgi:hypothetical protein
MHAGSDKRSVPSAEAIRAVQARYKPRIIEKDPATSTQQFARATAASIRIHLTTFHLPKPRSFAFSAYRKI